MSRPLRFWGSAAAGVLVYSVAAALLLPYEALGLATEADRWRAWLLTLWTGGVMSVLFGVTGLLGFLSPVGIREVVEAGSVTKAMEERRSARRPGGGGLPRKLRLVARRHRGAPGRGLLRGLGDPAGVTRVF